MVMAWFFGNDVYNSKVVIIKRGQTIAGILKEDSIFAVDYDSIKCRWKMTESAGLMKDRIEELDVERLSLWLQELKACNICPRECNADRFGQKLGWCRADASFSISSICIHRGEEPVISGDKGICNIFFTNCNLQCIYCQNHQISCNSNTYTDEKISLKEALFQITGILESGINIVGFVSPSHYVPHVKVIITALRALGLNPVFVYNTNGYDKPETIQSLEGFIDVYLPDYKYADSDLGRKYSKAGDYPMVALEALKEMYRQTGPELPLDEFGYVQKGMIIRHLVLPGHPGNSIVVLRNIACELSNDLHISLMSQYYPTLQVMHHEFLGRTLESSEYDHVADVLDELGFENGWVQDLSSRDHYLPDFEGEHPFE
jgi:putative pyruvate formate lyase activating enzyme